jgi:hypothetical protein
VCSLLYWLPWLIALTVLPVMLRLWAGDAPRNSEPPDADAGDRDPDLPLAA